MPRTYFFMGWNRDRDAVNPLVLDPLPTFHGIDYGGTDRTRYTMVTLCGRRNGRTYAASIYERMRIFGKPMLSMKDEDNAITWDAAAMERRPFRLAKEQPWGGK